MDRARALDDAARTAARAPALGRESLHLNPRRAVRRYGTVDHRPALDRLHQVAEQLQYVCEALVRVPSEDAAEPRPDTGFLAMLADLLDDVATVVTVVPSGVSAELTRRIDDDLAPIRAHHDGLTLAVRDGSTPLPRSWSVQGGLILAAEHALGALVDDSPSDRNRPRP